jgi:hypothetical protein
MFFPSWLMFFISVVLISFKHYMFITYITKCNIVIWLLAYIVREIKWVKKNNSWKVKSLKNKRSSLRIFLLVNMNELCIHNLLDWNKYNWQSSSSIMAMICNSTWQCWKNAKKSNGPWHDPSLRLATKARAWKRVNQECNLKVTFTLLGV